VCVEGGRLLWKVVPVECSGVGDGIDGVFEAGILWDEVMEVVFSLVSGGWY